MSYSDSDIDSLNALRERNQNVNVQFQDIDHWCLPKASILLNLVSKITLKSVRYVTIRRTLE